MSATLLVAKPADALGIMQPIGYTKIVDAGGNGG
jgi:hypothetical protein